METYRIYNSTISNATDGVFAVNTWKSIPIDPANRDYVQFKSDVLKGAELQDADGVAMSAADAKAYVKTLP